MTPPDEIIRALKRVVSAQFEANVALKEEAQEAAYWRDQAEVFEAECRTHERFRQAHLHIPWAVADELERALEFGDARHARRLWRRESQS